MKLKKSVRNMLICVGIICIAILADRFVQTKVNEILQIHEDDFSFVFQLDEATQIGDELVLKGWVFEIDVDAKRNDLEIILYDYVNDKQYRIWQSETVRNDVNEYFMCEYDYSKSGFEASIEIDRLDLQNTNYEVLVHYKDRRDAFRTGTYITDDGIMYTKPEDFIPLDVESTDLEKIVNEGVLRVYRPDLFLYIYQYEGDLYWITEDGYEFGENNRTIIQYQVSTSQVDRISQAQIDKGWKWDNLYFKFEKNEMVNADTGKYRVTVASLPTAYSVKKILTGYRVGDERKWRCNFRPWYEFD